MQQVLFNVLVDYFDHTFKIHSISSISASSITQYSCRIKLSLTDLLRINCSISPIDQIQIYKNK